MHRGPWRAACAASVLAACAAPALAQIPEKFTNLQVFPKDVPRAELVMAMRGIATDLGLRCHYCHVGPDDLQGMDFATDEKPLKRTAREMLRMLQSVNATVKALPPRDEPRQAATCHTCHRGAQRPPEALGTLIARTVQTEGADAAVTRYKEIRREHPSDGQYDLTPRALGGAVNRVFEAGRVDDALALARLNIELNPDVSQLHSQLGQILMKKDDRAGAAESFRRALKLDPANVAAERGLKATEGEPRRP